MSICGCRQGTLSAKAQALVSFQKLTYQIYQLYHLAIITLKILNRLTSPHKHQLSQSQCIRQRNKDRNLNCQTAVQQNWIQMDLTDKKMLYISYFRNSFGSFHPSHPNHISIYCYLLTKHHKLLQDYFIIMNSNSSNLFNQKHILLMAQILNKMGRFFQDMAYDCMQHLSPTSGQLPMVKEQKLQPQNHYKEAKDKQDLKRDSKLFKIKSHKPKHPVSSFFIFYKEKGQEIAKERGQILGCKIAKIVGELWKSMSDADKEPYQTKAKVARQKYEQEMIQYKVQYTDEIQRLKNYKRIARLKRKEAELREQKAEKQQKHQSQLVANQQAQISPEVKQEQESPIESSQSGSIPSSQSGSELEDGLSDSLQAITKREQQLGNVCGEIGEHRQQSVLSQKLKLQAGQMQFPLQQQILGELDILLKQNNKKEKTQPLPINNNQLPLANSLKIHLQKLQGTDQENSQSQESQSRQTVRPKAPISSFFLFYKDKGKEIAQQKGLAMGPKLIKVVSAVWKSMNPQDKKIYQVKALQTRTKYHQEMNQLKHKSVEKKSSLKKQKNNAQKSIKPKKKGKSAEE